ncbi:uncharacterized protein JCM15063_004521 [Sporobolomyces koalae]|uniref:uncharacterized protein n=1 Tax=Sporobolomyces koalae TaxID=500713 RepID=UPI003175EC63
MSIEPCTQPASSVSVPLVPDSSIDPALRDLPAPTIPPPPSHSSHAQVDPDLDIPVPRRKRARATTDYSQFLALASADDSEDSGQDEFRPSETDDNEEEEQDDYDQGEVEQSEFMLARTSTGFNIGQREASTRLKPSPRTVGKKANTFRSRPDKFKHRLIPRQRKRLMEIGALGPNSSHKYNKGYSPFRIPANAKTSSEGGRGRSCENCRLRKARCSREHCVWTNGTPLYTSLEPWSTPKPNLYLPPFNVEIQQSAQAQTQTKHNYIRISTLPHPSLALELVRLTKLAQILTTRWTTRERQHAMLEGRPVQNCVSLADIPLELPSKPEETPSTAGDGFDEYVQMPEENQEGGASDRPPKDDPGRDAEWEDAAILLALSQPQGQSPTLPSPPGPFPSTEKASELSTPSLATPTEQADIKKGDIAMSSSADRAGPTPDLIIATSADRPSPAAAEQAAIPPVASVQKRARQPRTHRTQISQRQYRGAPFKQPPRAQYPVAGDQLALLPHQFPPGYRPVAPVARYNRLALPVPPSTDPEFAQPQTAPETSSSVRPPSSTPVLPPRPGTVLPAKSASSASATPHSSHTVRPYAGSHYLHPHSRPLPSPRHPSREHRQPFFPFGTEPSSYLRGHPSTFANRSPVMRTPAQHGQPIANNNSATINPSATSKPSRPLPRKPRKRSPPNQPPPPEPPAARVFFPAIPDPGSTPEERARVGKERALEHAKSSEWQDREMRRRWHEQRYINVIKGKGRRVGSQAKPPAKKRKVEPALGAPANGHAAADTATLAIQAAQSWAALQTRNEPGPTGLARERERERNRLPPIIVPVEPYRSMSSARPTSFRGTQDPMLGGGPLTTGTEMDDTLANGGRSNGVSPHTRLYGSQSFSRRLSDWSLSPLASSYVSPSTLLEPNYPGPSSMNRAESLSLAPIATPFHPSKSFSSLAQSPSRPTSSNRLARDSPSLHLVAPLGDDDNGFRPYEDLFGPEDPDERFEPRLESHGMESAFESGTK